MSRTFIIIAAILGFTGVALGAFGAHGLESTLDENDQQDTYQTASEYHLYHALALLGVGILLNSQPKEEGERRFVSLRMVGYMFIAGVVIFSGSLYILAVADLSFMGAIAPIGGLALLGGWACLGLTMWQPLMKR